MHRRRREGADADRAVDGRRTPRRSTSGRSAVDRRACSAVAALSRRRSHAQMTADNGVETDVAELSGQPRDDQGRRRREVLDRQRGLSLQGRQPAARDEARGGRSARRRVLLRTPVRSVVIDRQRRARDRSRTAASYEADHVVVTAPPSTWNRIVFDPVLPLALAPQMGTQRQVPDRAEGAVLAAGRARPELADRRSRAPDLGRHRQQKGAGAGAGRVLRRQRAADTCRVWTAASADATTWRRSRRSTAASGQLRQGALHGLAVAIRGRRARTRSPRPAR